MIGLLHILKSGAVEEQAEHESALLKIFRDLSTTFSPAGMYYCNTKCILLSLPSIPTAFFEGNVQKLDSAVIKLSDMLETVKFISCSCGVLPNGNNN